MTRPRRGGARWAVAMLMTASSVAAIEAAPAHGTGPETVTAVELVSAHRLPRDVVLAAIGELVGRPRVRDAVRESLDRLWALGLFAAVRVEEEREAGGVRLRYHLVRRPHVQSVSWDGELGLDRADLAAAAALAVGDAAEPERLARARHDLLALYRREGFFGARLRIESREEPGSNGRDLAVIVTAGDRARIGPLQIRGTIRVPVAGVARAFGFQEGERYREGAIRDGVDAVEAHLRQRGFLEARVTLEEPVWDPESNRVALTLTLREGPEFRVEFLGATAVKESVLRDRLALVESGVVDALELEAGARQVEAAYRERGYHFVEVTRSLEEDGDVRVIRFHVTEGPRVTVDAVTFTGLESVAAERLRSRMETRPPGFLHPGLFRQEVLDRDLRVVVGFLRSQGFSDAVIGPAEFRFSEDRTRARISVPIVEGPRLTVEDVRVEGQALLTAEELLAAIPLRRGAPWDPARAEEGRRVVERLYARRGYHRTRVDVTTSRRDGAVAVMYRIAEGDQTRVGRILIRGLLLTKESVVLRGLPVRPGDPLDPDRLLEGQRNLAALQPFELVEVEPLRPPPSPFADVEVTLREKKPWRLDVGLGYGTDEGARGFVEVAHDNLFGTARSAGIRQKLSAGGQRTDFGDRTDLVYREPWFLGTPWQGEARLFRERREEIGFQLERAGVAAGIQRDLHPGRIHGLRGTVSYRLEQVRRSRVAPGLVAANVEPGSQLVASVTPALILDRRDDALDPRRGSVHLLSLEAGGAPVGGEVNFVKSRLETSWFLDWLSPTVLALSARLGLATPFGDTPDLAIEDRFFAGGATSVRGFRENRLGPRDARGVPRGGNGLAILSAEWRVPLFRWIGGAVFVDAGAVTREVADLGPDDLRAGAGGGLRLNTPVGPVRLDVGYAMRPVPGERRLQLYLTVGHPF